MRPLSGFVALVVVGLSTTVADAQPPWETVTAKDGVFSVEMPTKPTIDRTRTRKAPGGTVKTTTLGCRTDSGIYLAYRIDIPTALVSGAEDAELDAARDDFAQEWNGKVISEKKVKAGFRVGRDFTIRGRPAEEVGVLTIRFRIYLDGKIIYGAAVGSASNRELPEDAGRFLGSLALGAERVRAGGVTDPDPKGTNLPDWGLAIDPSADCKFLPDGKRALTIQVPGTWHDLNPHVNKLNAPRVVRTVEGDFSATVRVAGEFRPGGAPQNPMSVPSVGGGIVVWSNADNFIRLERFAVSRGGKVSPFVVFLEREGGYQGADHNEGYPGGDCYLRMERKGSRIVGSVSTDGTRWRQLQPIDTLWPARLKIGLVATNSTSEPHSVRFEEFTLTGKVGGAVGPKGK